MLLVNFFGGNQSASSSSESLTVNGSAETGDAMTASSSLSPPRSALILATRASSWPVLWLHTEDVLEVWPPNFLSS
ncbi:hypothetical protein L6164_022123 [Bauhinia variegata]|uniref:Uncharacterized protein n=1 Tax=Bauhinia variegata TaxID=167791 RepID=A0ACB9MFP8_BAUVA|nr:hypothetical protein L6164_022123 [Bauhinia variegata]